MGQCNLNKNRAPSCTRMTFTLQFDEFSFQMGIDSANHWFRSTDFYCRSHFTDVIFTICTIFQWWFLSGSHNILLINLARSVITGKSQTKALMYIHQGRAEVWDHPVMTDRTELILSYLLYGLFIITAWSRPWDKGGTGHLDPKISGGTDPRAPPRAKRSPALN